MRMIAPCLLALWLSAPALAQVYPSLSPETPRVQSVVFKPGQRIVMPALPKTALTVMLEPGQMITRVVLKGNRSWDVRVSAEEDSFQVTPEQGAAPAVLSVSTNAKTYEFSLEVSEGLQAGYLVRVTPPARSNPGPLVPAQPIAAFDWSYKLRGDRTVRPSSIRDNGLKTVIEYAPGQALPAVFAIGPSGDEEVVDGYMRDGRFVIDRVHSELVFRIDKEKARARRNKRRDGAK